MSYSYYNYDPNDIAKSIQRAMEDRADPDAVAYLLEERNKKITTSPQYTGYENDMVTQAAENYIQKYSPATQDDLDTLYEARRDLAADNLLASAIQNANTFAGGVNATQTSHANARGGMYSAYQRSALGNEEMLASQGLGRGSANRASSGFGESSRAMQSAAYQNNVYGSYQDQNAAIQALASQYMDSQNAARMAYNDALAQISSDQTRDTISQRNADREFGFKVDQSRLEEQHYNAEAQQKQQAAEYERALNKLKLTGVVTDEQQAAVLGLEVGMTTADYEDMLFTQEMNRMKFDSAEEQRAFENSLAERKFENQQQQDQFERAYNLFKAIGSVQTNEMASVLGVPIGTTYWDYVIAQRKADVDYLNYTVKNKNANTSAAKAAASRANAANNASIKQEKNAIDKQNADTRRYEAETKRMELTGDYE